MVDQIAFRFYGTSVGTTEAILQANPSLASYDLLPPGLTITLPAQPPAPAAAQVKLWQ